MSNSQFHPNTKNTLRDMNVSDLCHTFLHDALAREPMFVQEPRANHKQFPREHRFSGSRIVQRLTSGHKSDTSSPKLCVVAAATQ